jgi:hypothetical protein
MCKEKSKMGKSLLEVRPGWPGRESTKRKGRKEDGELRAVKWYKMSILFSTAGALLYILTYSTWGPNSPHPCQHLLFFGFFVFNSNYSKMGVR